MRLLLIRCLNTAPINQTIGKLKSDVPILWQTFKSTNQAALYKRLTNVNSWYTKIIGLDEVKLYQDRVVSFQEKLLKAQESRREIGQQLADIRKKSNQLQDEIHKVKRSEDIERFLSLMKEETEVLKAEQEISRSFQECDRTERELFTAFTNAVRDSNEKQRAQVEYTKYFGIILSIAGSFLAFCYTTLRKHDLKIFIEDSLAKHLSENKPVVISNNANNHSNVDTSNKELVNLFMSECSKLKNLVQQTQNDIAHLTKLEPDVKSPKREYLLYGLGITAVVLVALVKLTSS